MNTAAPIKGIHHAAIAAPQYDKAVAFYEALGFVPYKEWGEGASRVCLMDAGGGAYIELFAAGALPQDACGANFMHLAFSVSDVEKTYRLAIGLGAREKQPPKTVVLDASPTPVSITCAFVYGINGETLEFFRENPL